jgi:hypothetical protein
MLWALMARRNIAGLLEKPEFWPLTTTEMRPKFVVHMIDGGT